MNTETRGKCRRAHADATQIRPDRRDRRRRVDWRARPRERGLVPSRPGIGSAGRETGRPDDRALEQREPARPGQARARRGARGPSDPPARSRAAIPAPPARSSRRWPSTTASRRRTSSLGCGSTQILRSATHLFTARTKALVGTIPTYEECAGYADMMGHPVRAIPLDSAFNVDLDRMADAARGAGLVFFCNPEQPCRDLRRRPRDARLHRARQPHLARDDDPRRRGVFRVRHRRRITRRTSRRPSKTRASSSRALSRSPTAWPACASATPSATSTRSARWPSSTAAPARAR